MTARATARQSQVVRAIKAAKTAGLNVTGFEIKPDGTICVHSGENPAPLVPAAANESHGAAAPIDDWSAEA